MIPYRDWDNDSNVAAFEVGESYIDVAFKSGAIYRYTSVSAGAENLRQMIAFARGGEGLNSFINRVIRKNYSQRLR